MMDFLLKALLWEGGWWLLRRNRRGYIYTMALNRSKILNRPLLVVGAPDHGPTAGYGCGDITMDIEETSSCPNFYSVDITKGIPLPDNSVVAFVPCTLEYVEDYGAAMKHLLRVTGGELYITSVEPWSFTAWFYPGGKRILGIDGLLPAKEQLHSDRLPTRVPLNQ